jgi:eukaryotic-like serine/threonine-protein kinase
MTDSVRTEDSSLLSIAAAIARGEPVDWSSMPAEDPETTTILGELRSLEGLSRVGHPIPDTWGPYEITGEIGHGSYGTVYCARDNDLGLELALKVIRPKDPGDQAAATVALQEARLLAQITHPNVVRIYGAERVGSEVGIAMELVQGQTLHRIVAAQGSFSANETMLLGGDLCRAVAAVHGARLLHGDIKANNVMRAQGGRTVLMDFGAGHDLKSAGGSTRRPKGTPLYLAPEVLAGGAPTVASDIYSIGVLLFYLSTGTYPVQGHSRQEVEQAHLSHAPRRLLRDVRPDLPESFIHIVERATAARPEDRHATAGELEAALARALRSEERLPAPPIRIARWPLAIAAAVMVAVAGLAYRAWGPSGAPATPQIATAVSTSPDPAPAAPATPADAYEVEAAFYRQDGNTAVRLQPGARVAPGELLSLQIRSSVPSWVYVVNEDEKGDSFLLFPLPGQQLANPLPPGELHEIPGVVDGERVNWEVSSAGGREHFLVWVTPQEPNAAFKRMFSSLSRPKVGATVMAQRLNNDHISALRGVGGLVKMPASPGVVGPLSREYTVPLPSGAETARGVWVRQLTLENPVR